ncbi:MAG: hypothetical protein ACT4P6_18480 [Gemmatimonadaceae bacterium]
MRFRTITALLTTTAILAACSDSVTTPTPALDAELEEIVFDVSASPNDVAAAAERRDRPRGERPPERRLTEEQKQCIQDAIEAFREANKETLAALQAIHQKAREAKAAGATREEVARILQQAQPLLERLRSAHEALHEKIRACLAR